MKNKALRKLLQVFEEAIDELVMENPPRIELKGWWWKKYIPYYQRMRDMMQEIIAHQWRDNYPEIRKELKQRVEEYWKHDLQYQLMDKRKYFYAKDLLK